ncbi:MAG: class I SAM-dependent methyltransferase [Colwellia sp.]|nr:class I SAM-dependent methyltransferase [Colwellia sp.]
MKNFYEEKDFIGDAQSELDRNSTEKVEYWSFPDLYKKHKSVFGQFFEDRLSKIMRYHHPHSSMLDIGCGYGFWLNFCRERGFDVLGIDVSETAISWARHNFQISVMNSSIESFSPERTFDVIVMCDVLEHFIEPVEQLKRLSDMLSDNGVLYIQVPNLLGFKLRNGQGYHLPYHVWQFSLRSIKNLLSKCGFEILDNYCGVMGVIGVYEKGGPGWIDKIRWKLSSSLKVGNRLQVVAKKSLK